MAGAYVRGAKEGLGYGVIAGIVFAFAEMLASVVMGNTAFMPFRMFASVVLGQDALDATPLGTALLAGTLVHLALSAAFGALYGVILAQLSPRSQTSSARQIGMGLLYGAVLWLVNFQIIARLAYPWFLGAPQLLQALLHALFFGLPLGQMIAGAERRSRRVIGARAIPAS